MVLVYLSGIPIMLGFTCQCLSWLLIRVLLDYHGVYYTHKLGLSPVISHSILFKGTIFPPVHHSSIGAGFTTTDYQD